MTTKRLYCCDLCKADINDRHTGIGIHFTADAIEERNLWQAEHHICDECCASLQKLFEDRRKKAPWQAS